MITPLTAHERLKGEPEWRWATRPGAEPENKERLIEGRGVFRSGPACQGRTGLELRPQAPSRSSCFSARHSGSPCPCPQGLELDHKTVSVDASSLETELKARMEICTCSEHV